MQATTTQQCEYSAPVCMTISGATTTCGEGSPFNFSSSTCITVIDSTEKISPDAEAHVYFLGIVLFLAMIFWWKGKFKIDRYE